ncbi:MAG: hypothetical protein IPK25_03505 [Saprospiraceae bacterium]|nr:hypothetical protein [Saprospiraceae bacterium]
MVELISGSAFRNLLKRKDISYKHISKEFNIHSSNVGRNIRNPKNMSASFLFILARYTKIDVYEFINADKKDFVIPYKVIDEIPEPPYTD